MQKKVFGSIFKNEIKEEQSLKLKSAHIDITEFPKIAHFILL